MFISYKRGDAEIAAALVADKIDAADGPGTAFLAPRSLTLGIDFNEAIHDALHRSVVLVAVIGPSWLRESAAAGRQLTPEERVARIAILLLGKCYSSVMDSRRLLAEALQLPDEERAALAGELIQGLDHDVDPDAEAAWSVEIRARLAQVDAGTATTVSWTEARRRIHAATQRGPRP